MRVIQLNLNHCEAAQDLLTQSIREKRVDLAMISEPFRIPQNGKWISDRSRKATIWSCGSCAFQDTAIQFNGFVRAKIKGVNFYSCYAPPSWTHIEFQDMLDELLEDARNRTPVAIAGDFNAWAKEWGSRTTNARGRSLLETLASLDLVLLNDGKTYTFGRAGAFSIIDLTFVSPTLSLNTKWRVSEHYTHSDHQAILFEVTLQKNQEVRKSKTTGPKWKDTAFDKEFFEEMISSGQLHGDSPNALAHEINNIMAEACDASMPRRSVSKSGNPCYWWNENIRALRAACFRARRKMQRTRGRPDFESHLVTFRNVRKSLKVAIKNSKSDCFKRLCDEADTNPWGTAYRLVMKKLNKSPQITCPIMLRNIITTLFPEHPLGSPIQTRYNGNDAIPNISLDELKAACLKIGDSKAPGPDGIPNVALKSAITTRPDLFLHVFQSCIENGIFPDQWKIQRLVLIPKGNKPPNEPSSYRPICLLDTMGKILERIIYNRLLPVIEEKGALSERQYGFRKSRSTIDAVKTVVDIALQAISGERWKGGSKEYCAVVTLDVKNAFNSANWDHIYRALARMEVPNYILALITSYFTERKLIYESDNGVEQYNITAGVPQGSVLGPLLWNIMYNEVLNLPLPEGVLIIGFADDIGIVTVAKHISQIEAATSAAIAQVKTWMELAKLELAEHKTEALLITSRKKVEFMNVTVGNQVIHSTHSLKYLGVMLDNRLNFKDHIEYVSQKASKIQGSLARILPNIGGPKPARRKLLATVINSVILYASPVWTDGLDLKCSKKKLISVHRLSVLRTISGFRTISEDAACVVAGMIPIDILAEEMKRIYERSPENNSHREACAKEERIRSIAIWQDRWNRSTKGRWTYRLIPRIEPWLNRKHGETNFYLTQFLTGHGCYRKYLHRFGHDSSPKCPSCVDEDEDAEHVMFQCPRFGTEFLSGTSAERVVDHMLNNAENWSHVSEEVSNILKELRRLERRRHH